jgi:DNA-binding protein HU-beta
METIDWNQLREKLNAQRDNLKMIEALMRLYGFDEARAREAWELSIDAMIEESEKMQKADARQGKKAKEWKPQSRAITKSELAAHLAGKFNLSKKAANEVLDELAAVAVAQTRKVGAFTLPGIGQLVKAHQAPRVGRNPVTGRTIKLPAKTAVKFRIAKAAQDEILGAKKTSRA